ncbi:MAG TPA: HD domain-containing protein [Pirellulaceae bacterium]|jgi:guanosine-3',5'-bis(diphosphate) 3'-pyrophosphohydrolase
MTDSKREKPWQRAVSFAARQHDGQLRKDGKTPYVAHPVRVAFIVRHLFEVDDETAVTAALLHDLIEDTKTDYDEVAHEFGSAVAGVVAAVSKDGRLPHDEREATYDQQVAAASWQARLIKLADVYDNYCDSRDDKERARAAEKAWRAIHCAGNAPELARAVKLVQKLIENA